MDSRRRALRVFRVRGQQIRILRQGYGRKVAGREDVIHRMIEGDLPSFFPGMELVRRKPKIGDMEPDTLAFDRENRSFAIIEYKNVMDPGHVTQGHAYYRRLNERRGDVVQMHNECTGDALRREDVSWDETRVILISPEFDKYQRESAADLRQRHGVQIELHEIALYDGGVITLDWINGAYPTRRGAGRARGGKRGGRKSPGTGALTVDDHLRGKPSAGLYRMARDAIMAALPGVVEIPRKVYIGFCPADNNSPVCTIGVLKNELKLCYSIVSEGVIEPSGFVEHSKKGKHGVGDYVSRIRSKGDIDSAVPLIRKVYEHKASPAPKPAAGAGGTSPRSVTGYVHIARVVADLLSSGKATGITDVYQAVFDAGHRDETKTRHNARSALDSMRRAGRARSISKGVWQAT